MGFDRPAIRWLAAAAFISIAAMRACDPLLPALVTAFGVSTGEAAKTISIFAIAYGGMQLVFGYLGDRYGKFRVIAFAVLASTLGNLVALLAQDFDTLVLARFLSGATGAGIVPLSLAWIGDTVAYEQRQVVLAKLMTAMVLGTSLGQLLSGVLTDWLGWRWVFALTSTAFLAVGWELLRLERERREIAAHAHPGNFPQKLASVFSGRWARIILALTLTEGAFVFSALAFMPAHFHGAFSISLKAAAAIAVLYSLGGLAYSLRAGAMVARYGESGLAWLGGVCMVTAYLTMAFAPHWGFAVVACLVGGFGFNMFHNTLQTQATQMAPQARGTAMALFGGGIFVGQSLGVWGAALAVDRYGFPSVFVACALATALIAYAFWAALQSRHH
jgi:predicted MFS family arabinose efflux permease